MAEKGKTFTGARARLSVEGVPVGYATGCSGSETIRYEPIEVLDNIQVEEYVPVAYEVTFSAEFVRIVGKTPKGDGFFPKVGGTTADHLKNILTGGDLTITLEDTQDPATNVMTLEQAKVTSHNWRVNARGVVGHDMTFVAVRMGDENDIIT